MLLNFGNVVFHFHLRDGFHLHERQFYGGAASRHNEHLPSIVLVLAFTQLKGSGRQTICKLYLVGSEDY
jgi:hypothetical protein